MYTMLIKARYRKGRRNVFLIVALFLFIVATLDVALLLRHVLDAFIWYRGSGGAPAELSNISYWVNVMKTVTYVAQTSIGDGMLVSCHVLSGNKNQRASWIQIYRCYVVYAGHGWLVAVPLCILWVAGMSEKIPRCLSPTYFELTTIRQLCRRSGATLNSHSMPTRSSTQESSSHSSPRPLLSPLSSTLWPPVFRVPLSVNKQC